MPQTQTNDEGRDAMTTFQYAGTVSHGTLREEDLVPAFLSVLKDMAPEEAQVIEERYADEIAHLQEGKEPNADRLGWLMEDLFDALNEKAPEGWSFGAHEGDGSDFGFWWGEDEEDGE